MPITTRISPNPIVDNPRLPTGSRDDSPDGVDLPLVDLVAQAPPEAAQRFRNWPGPVARWQWAVDVGVARDLSAMQVAILQHVCMRSGQRNDGTAPGCHQSAENIGIETRYSRRHVGLALTALVKKGLLEKMARSHCTSVYRPTFNRVNVTLGNIGLEPRVTQTRNKPEGVYAQNRLSNMYLLEEGEPAIVDNADSCGFTGCPPVDRVCPMCGRQGSWRS